LQALAGRHRGVGVAADYRRNALFLVVRCSRAEDKRILQRDVAGNGRTERLGGRWPGARHQ
jgi:hypothetical protein